MLALPDRFQLMSAQQMGDHFFFCLYQLKLALIYYLRFTNNKLGRYTMFYWNVYTKNSKSIHNFKSFKAKYTTIRQNIYCILTCFTHEYLHNVCHGQLIKEIFLQNWYHRFSLLADQEWGTFRKKNNRKECWRINKLHSSFRILEFYDMISKVRTLRENTQNNHYFAT